MKKFAAVILSVVFASTAFAAETTQRYLVATRAAMPAARIGIMFRDIEGVSKPSPGSSRNIVAFDNVNGFAADLTTEEAAALAKSADVRYVEPAVERRPVGPVEQRPVEHPDRWQERRRDLRGRASRSPQRSTGRCQVGLAVARVPGSSRSRRRASDGRLRLRRSAWPTIVASTSET